MSFFKNFLHKKKQNSLEQKLLSYQDHSINPSLTTMLDTYQTDKNSEIKEQQLSHEPYPYDNIKALQTKIKRLQDSLTTLEQQRVELANSLIPSHLFLIKNDENEKILNELVENISTTDLKTIEALSINPHLDANEETIKQLKTLQENINSKNSKIKKIQKEIKKLDSAFENQPSDDEINLNFSF